MQKVLFTLLAMVSSPTVSAQGTDPLVISFFSNYEVKTAKAEIPWAFYHFSLEGYLVFDAVARMDDGRIVQIEATDENISADKGGTELYSGFPIRSDAAVARVCFTNFRVCTSRDIGTCRPFGRSLFFEVDMNTGAAVTSIPLGADAVLPKGSDQFKVQLCSTSELNS